MTITRLKVLLITILILINVFDVVLHVVIGQPELLRIISNSIMIISGLIAYKLPYSKILTGTAAIAYIVLNLLVIAQNGIGVVGMLLIIATVLTSLGVMLRPSTTNRSR